MAEDCPVHVNMYDPTWPFSDCRGHTAEGTVVGAADCVGHNGTICPSNVNMYKAIGPWSTSECLGHIATGPISGAGDCQGHNTSICDDHTTYVDSGPPFSHCSTHVAAGLIDGNADCVTHATTSASKCIAHVEGGIEGCDAHDARVCPSQSIEVPSSSITWTDDPLSTSIKIKAIHFNELRTSIISELTRRGLTWVDETNAVTTSNKPIGVKIRQLRSGLHQAMSWTHPTVLNDSELETGDTVLKDQIIELRNQVRFVETGCSCNCDYSCTCQCDYCTCNCAYSCTCVCNYSCTCDCNYCVCNCNYNCTCQCDYSCTCDCNYCTCNCNYACTCQCNYCTCNCNYCTCNCNYDCTCVCAYEA